MTLLIYAELYFISFLLALWGARFLVRNQKPNRGHPTHNCYLTQPNQPTATPRSITQHHAASRSITQHHAALHSTTQHQYIHTSILYSGEVLRSYILLRLTGIASCFNVRYDGEARRAREARRWGRWGEEGRREEGRKGGEGGEVTNYILIFILLFNRSVHVIWKVEE